MFKRRKRIFSLKAQVLAYFIIATLLPLLIISVYFYSRSLVMEKQIAGESHFKVISHIVDNIDRQYEQASTLSDWIYLDQDIGTLLNRTPEETRRFDTANIRAISNIERQFQYLPITRYLRSLFILGINGLDLRYGPEGALVEPEDFTKSDWFLKALELNDQMYWGGAVRNLTTISDDMYVNPQVRIIKNYDTGKVLGYAVMFYSQAMFNDLYREMLLHKGERIYLIDSAGSMISTNQDIRSLSQSPDGETVQAALQNPDTPYYEKTIDGKIHLVTYKKSDRTGWTLVEIVPMVHIQNQKTFLERTTYVMIAGLIAMCFFLSLFLSENLTRPIKILVGQVKEIGQGNFQRRHELNVSNEIGILSWSISRMKEDINSLLQESIRKEKEKRVIEIKMLQSQINPHFLYNTLNSIRMMAALQGARGIERVAVSLGRILKAALSGVNEKVPLHEEIGILEDYISIQNIRCNGSVRYQKTIEDEKLLNCKVIKFMLQPIVENTIIHGLGPKEYVGEVSLSVSRRENNLVVEIIDDGIGMSEEKIRSIMEIPKAAPDEASSGGGLGIQNIIRRIRLVYGEAYGLQFESEQGKYTKITVILPIEEKEGD